MSKIAFTQRVSPDTLRLGLVFRRLRKNDKLKHVATARPLLLRGVERGVSIRRGHPILCRPTKLCQESIPAHRHPGPLTLGQVSPGCKPFLRAPVGSNTETDDDCRPATFHRGRFRCEAPFTISTVARENPPPSIGSLYVVVNRTTIFLI